MSCDFRRKSSVCFVTSFQAAGELAPNPEMSSVFIYAPGPRTHPSHPGSWRKRSTTGCLNGSLPGHPKASEALSKAAPAPLPSRQFPVSAPISVFLFRLPSVQYKPLKPSQLPLGLQSAEVSRWSAVLCSRDNTFRDMPASLSCPWSIPA